MLLLASVRPIELKQRPQRKLLKPVFFFFFFTQVSVHGILQVFPEVSKQPAIIIGLNKS